MSAAYSYDLRRKVIEAIDGGMGKTQASKIFKISRNTINLWLRKREETGDYRASVGYQRGYGAKITDLEEFQEFARKHGSQTQKEMASSWPGEISDRTIGKALKKIRFTRKKNLRLSRKRSGEKARVFDRNLSKKPRRASLYR
jgi:transposase